MENLSNLKTEQVNPDAKGIHHLNSTDLLKLLLKYQIRSVDAVDAELNNIAQIIHEATHRLKDTDGRIVVVGAGTSIRLAVQNIIELQTHGWPRERTEYIIAGGKKALVASREGGEDNVNIPRNRVKSLSLNENDILIGASASGRTPFVVSALTQARKQGAMTVAIANNENSNIQEIAEFGIFLNTEKEPIGGSTRMNAGTSQKICFDLLTNGMMKELDIISDENVVELFQLTEGFSSLKVDTTTLSTHEFLKCLLAQQKQSIESVGKQIPVIADAAEALAKNLIQESSRMLVAGAGTAARALVQEIAELYPTFGFVPEQAAYGIAGGDGALLHDYHDLDDQEQHAFDLMKEFNPKAGLDIAILGSIGGKTKYTNCLAQHLGIITIGLCNVPDGPLLQYVDYPILLETSKNPLGKLTRLGAGTSHKVALNILTSSAMTRMGHVYDGHMIDVKLFCEKLVERAKNMVIQITDCPPSKAEEALLATGKKPLERNVTRAVLYNYGVEPENFEKFIKEKGDGKSSLAIEAAKNLSPS